MSRGLLAWPVESDPSWPVVIAWSMSSASPERHSPTMIRSGRMCIALRSRLRIVISPSPSRLGGRDSSVITCSWRSWSSAASSIVTMRSSLGMKPDSTLSVVVLPEPVPPETNRFSRASMHARRNSNISGVAVPNRMRSSTVYGRVENFRTVMTGPISESGSMIALTREPSGRRASTRGLDSSMRRPIGVMIRSMTRSTCSSLRNVVSTRRILPRALDVDVVGAVDHHLGDGLVVEQRLDRPEAGDVVDHLVDRRARSSRVTAKPCFVTTRSKMPSILGRTSLGRRVDERVERADDLGLEHRAGSRGSAPRGPACADDGRDGGARTGTRAVGGGAATGRRAVAALERWRPVLAASLRSFDSLEQRHRLGSPLDPRRDITEPLARRVTPERGSVPPNVRGSGEHNAELAEVRCGVAPELMRSGRVGAGRGGAGPWYPVERPRPCSVYSPSGVGL